MARPRVPEELKKKRYNDYMRLYMREYIKRKKEQSFSEAMKNNSSPAPRHPSAVSNSERQVL